MSKLRCAEGPFCCGQGDTLTQGAQFRLSSGRCCSNCPTPSANGTRIVNTNTYCSDACFAQHQSAGRCPWKQEFHQAEKVCRGAELWAGEHEVPAMQQSAMHATKCQLTKARQDLEEEVTCKQQLAADLLSVQAKLAAEVAVRQQLEATVHQAAVAAVAARKKVSQP
jgi:hypothetical protein